MQLKKIRRTSNQYLVKEMLKRDVKINATFFHPLMYLAELSKQQMYTLHKNICGASKHISKRPEVWSEYIKLLTPDPFKETCSKCYSRWELLRNGGWQIHARKHGIEACMFSVLGVIGTGMSDLMREGVASMSHGLINVEFG